MRLISLILWLIVWIWSWPSEAFIVQPIEGAIAHVSKITVGIARISNNNNFDTELSSVSGCVAKNIVVVNPSPQVRMGLVHFYQLNDLFWDNKLRGCSCISGTKESARGEIVSIDEAIIHRQWPCRNSILPSKVHSQKFCRRVTCVFPNTSEAPSFYSTYFLPFMQKYIRHNKGAPCNFYPVACDDSLVDGSFSRFFARFNGAQHIRPLLVSDQPKGVRLPIEPLSFGGQYSGEKEQSNRDDHGGNGRKSLQGVMIGVGPVRDRLEQGQIIIYGGCIVFIVTVAMMIFVVVDIKSHTGNTDKTKKR